jgi:hypothetical protein
MMTIEQRETLRMAVLNFLAPRHVAAFNASQIADRLRAERRVDFAITPADITDACGLLVKLELVDRVSEIGFSVVLHYQASGKGVVESERWRLDRGME